MTSLDDLERRRKAGRVAELEGFGAKTQAKILGGTWPRCGTTGRTRLGDVDAVVRP